MKKAETLTNRVVERDVKSYNRMFGYICITITRMEQSIYNYMRVGKRHQETVFYKVSAA